MRRFRKVFDEIRKVKYETYKSKNGMGPGKEPWKVDIIERAELITTKAREASRYKLNEASWRNQFEHLIFHVFEYDITWYVSKPVNQRYQAHGSAVRTKAVASGCGEQNLKFAAIR